MSRNESSRRQPGRYAKNKFEFVNVDFTPQEKEEVLSWCDERNINLEDAIMDLAAQRYKVSFSFNSWTAQYVMAVTGKDAERPAFNRCIVYEHIDISRLVQVFMYLLERHLENEVYYEDDHRRVNDW